MQVEKAERALNTISGSIYGISQDCFAQASNIFKLDVQADEVNISNLTVNASYGNTSVGTCSSSTGISEGPLHGGLDSSMNSISTVNSDGTINDSYSNSPINMKTVIRDSIRVDVVNRCLAIALNSVVIRVQNARQFNLDNVTVDQTATADIKECIGNVIVNIGNTSQSLQQFLERNADQYNVAGYTPPAHCAGYEAAKNSLLYGAVASFLGAFIIAALFILAYYMQRKNLMKSQ